MPRRTTHAARAVLQLRGLKQAKERVRANPHWGWLDEIGRNIRYASRVLRRHPVGTATGTLSLAVGIGLNAAVSSVVDGVPLRPCLIQPHELAHIFTAGRAQLPVRGGVTHDEFVSFSRAAAVRQPVGFTNTTRILSGAGLEPGHVMISRVAGNFFATFGVHPDVGRPFMIATVPRTQSGS